MNKPKLKGIDMRTVEAIAAGTFAIIDMTGLRLRSMKTCDNVLLAPRKEAWKCELHTVATRFTRNLRKQ
jgi:hypothetical protein